MRRTHHAGVPSNHVILRFLVLSCVRALAPVQNDALSPESQHTSQDADAAASAARPRLPTTLNKLHESTTGATKPLARPTESGRATRGGRRRHGRRVLALRLRRVGRGHGFCRWFNTIDKIRLKHDGLEAARGFTAHESR